MPASVKCENSILKIEVPLEPPTLSASGKTFLVASTHGLMNTNLKHNGKDLMLVLNAFIFKEAKAARTKRKR